MLDCDPELILQFLFAGTDLLARRRERNLRQPWMRAGMGANLLTRSQPFFDLAGIHQPFHYIPLTLLSFVGLAQQIRHQELNAPKAMLPKQRQTILEYVDKSVVEGEEDLRIVSCSGRRADSAVFGRLKASPP